MIKLKEGWKKYEKPTGGREFADNLYQKHYKNDIYINVYEYLATKNMSLGYELDVQIMDEQSVVEKTMNITLFSYKELDFDLFEKDGEKIIELLT